MIRISVDDSEIIKLLTAILEKVNTLATQAELDAQTARLVQFETDLNTALTAIQAELTAVINNNPGVDLAGLTTAVDALAPLLTTAQTEATEIPPVTP
jgi:hypothetical protein